MNRRTLENSFLRIEYLADSLRIMGLLPKGKSNLLAEIKDFPPINTPYGDFHFRGGHRLWHAPEAMPRTYIPDVGDLKITEVPDGVVLETQIEPISGIRKRIEIRLLNDKPAVSLKHVLVNDGLWPVELAPWAITQFRLGGTVILPMPSGNVDPAGLLPNRHFSFWPYSLIKDPRLLLEDKFALFKADAMLPPFKLGYLNPGGWMAYWVGGVLFRKTFDYQEGSTYPDNNCNAEMYCNDQFVELESLAPLAILNPGMSAEHIETWTVSSSLDELPSEIQHAITGL